MQLPDGTAIIETELKHTTVGGVWGGGGGGKGNSYNGLYGETPPERGTFFMIQVHESCVGITLVEVYERVEESVISVFKRAQNGQQMHIMAVKEPRKLSGFVIYSYLKESAFTAVKRQLKGTQCYKLGL